MSLHSLTSFITAFTSLVLGLLVYYKNRKQVLNITLFLMCNAVSIWSFFYGIMVTTSNVRTALYSARILNYGAMLIPSFYVHFIITLLDYKFISILKFIIYYVKSCFSNERKKMQVLLL